MSTVDVDVRRPAGFADAARSEWTKFRSVRSSYWTLVVAILLGVGLSALICGIGASHYHSDPEIHFGWNPVNRSFFSLRLAQLAFAVLGVLVVTAEYSTGMIRTSLAAVPRRSRMMSAKLLVFAAVAVIIGELIAFGAFLVGQAAIGNEAPSATLGQHLVVRAVIGAGLYLTLIGLLGGGFALIFRHAASGIAVIVAILFILPGIIFALPQSWSQPLEKYWPTEAGSQITRTHRDAHTLTAWWGLGEMALFTVVVLAVAFYLLEVRDA